MTAPAPREEPMARTVSEITTLLGRGSDFEGKLTFEGAVRIEGNFKGEVFSDDVLIIGDGAHVEAEIDIGEIIIQGTVIGNIRARRGIEIRKPGRVKGDITTPSLQIERGVVFEGRSFMEEAVERASGVKAAPAPASSSGGGSSGGGGSGGGGKGSKEPAGK